MNTEIAEAEQNVVIQIREENQAEAEQNVVTQIAEENQVSLADSIKLDIIKSLPPSTTTRCSIYRVREKFRKISEFAHTPEIISIGPFHHGNGSLAAMENHKSRYAHALLSRTTSNWIYKSEECVACMEKIEDEVRQCYSEPFKDIDKAKFVQMMVIDGLFLIELFRRNKDTTIPIDLDDPFFGKVWGLPSTAHDLLLLENQFPMVVLMSLFDVLGLKEELGGVSLNILALEFFNQYMPRLLKVDESSSSGHQGNHLLDLLGKAFNDFPRVSPNDGLLRVLPNDGNGERDSIPNVTELKRAGVKFVTNNSTGGNFLDIKFEDGVMEIPSITIQDLTDTLFRNFIASEQCCDGHVSYMTSYAYFMDSLIDSAQDVGVLRKQGIIINYLGDDEDVASLFNKLCRDVSVTNFYYSKLCKDVNTYYNTRRNVWGAAFRRDYLGSPWKFISFVGAIILLVLTFLGSLFAILSYIKQT